MNTNTPLHTRILDNIVYYLWDKPVNSLRDLRFWFKSTYFAVTKGWRPEDAWDMGVWFCKYAPKILRHLAKTSTGYPVGGVVNDGRMLFPEIFPDAVPLSDEEAKNYPDSDADAWRLVINSLADLIQNSNANTCAYKNEVEVTGEIFTSTPMEPKLDVEGSKKCDILHRLNTVENASFNAWCKREDEIEALCSANLPRALKIFAELLPYLWS